MLEASSPCARSYHPQSALCTLHSAILPRERSWCSHSQAMFGEPVPLQMLCVSIHVCCRDEFYQRSLPMMARYSWHLHKWRETLRARLKCSAPCMELTSGMARGRHVLEACEFVADQFTTTARLCADSEAEQRVPGMNSMARCADIPLCYMAVLSLSQPSRQRALHPWSTRRMWCVLTLVLTHWES